MDLSDLDVVEMRTAKLSNEGAKHRISVKPKARRASTKASMKQREVRVLEEYILCPCHDNGRGIKCYPCPSVPTTSALSIKYF